MFHGKCHNTLMIIQVKLRSSCGLLTAGRNSGTHLDQWCLHKYWSAEIFRLLFPCHSPSLSFPLALSPFSLHPSPCSSCHPMIFNKCRYIYHEVCACQFFPCLHKNLTIFHLLTCNSLNIVSKSKAGCGGRSL